MKKITEEDLIGQLQGFPIYIVEAMIANQEKQGNPANVKVFQNKVDASYIEGGFNWTKSKEGQLFWSKVINARIFPENIIPSTREEAKEVVIDTTEKEPEYKIGEVIKPEEGGIARIVIAYIPNIPKPYLTISKKSYEMLKNGEPLETIRVVPLAAPKKYVYLTFKDISEGKGVGVDPTLIRIVP